MLNVDSSPKIYDIQEESVVFNIEDEKIESLTMSKALYDDIHESIDNAIYNQRLRLYSSSYESPFFGFGDVIFQKRGHIVIDTDYGSLDVPITDSHLSKSMRVLEVKLKQPDDGL